MGLTLHGSVLGFSFAISAALLRIGHSFAQSIIAAKIGHHHRGFAHFSRPPDPMLAHALAHID